MKKLIKILVIMAFWSQFSACGQANKPGSTYVEATPAEFEQGIKSENAYILDVRTPQEYNEGHIADAHNLDWLNQASFRAGAQSLPKEDTIYLYCRSGKRSAEASAYLSSLGYKVVDLDGGYMSWLKYSH